eukprot:517778-Pelagomonas_calceolata.AAC.1
MEGLAKSRIMPEWKCHPVVVLGKFVGMSIMLSLILSWSHTPMPLPYINHNVLLMLIGWPRASYSV